MHHLFRATHTEEYNEENNVPVRLLMYSFFLR